MFFNLLQQLPSCVSCSSSSYVSKNSTSSPFSSPSHYSLSSAYMNSWPYPSLFIIFIFTFVATIPSFPIHCFCRWLWLQELLTSPPFPIHLVNLYFVIAKDFGPPFLFIPFVFIVRASPFLVYCFHLCLVPTWAPNLSPFFFILCLQKLSFCLFVTFICFYL